MNIHKSKIIKNSKIAKDTFLLEFKYTYNFLPSQFIMIDTYPYRFLLKPFTIAGYKNGITQIIYRVISDGTKYLSVQKDKISFLGPFGNTKKIKRISKQIINKNIAFVAGGSGIASILFLYNYFKKLTKNLVVFYGEKDKSYVINIKQFDIRNVIYSTDNGTFGEKGSVVDVFSKYLQKNSIDYIFCCGSKAMIKSLQDLLKEKNISSFTLLEEYMCCGVGVCRSCVVKVKNANNFVYQSVCKDGPIFELKNIVI